MYPLAKFSRTHPSIHPEELSRKNARLLWHSVALAKKDAYFLRKDGTGEGTRTPTLVKEADFESAASTNSATPAPGKTGIN